MKEILVGVLSELLASTILQAIKSGISNRKMLLLVYHSKFKYKNKRIRISAAGIYRIQVDDKFMLIRGNRIQQQIQPVGGVYKFYESSRSILEDLGVEHDNTSFKFDAELENDLRIKIPGKNLLRFLRWFLNNKGREITPQREFKEELIDEGILPLKQFCSLNESFIKRETSDIHYSIHFDCQEVRIIETFRIEFNSEQKQILKTIPNGYKDKIFWVSEEEIRRQGYNPVTTQTNNKVAETASLLLNN